MPDAGAARPLLSLEGVRIVARCGVLVENFDLALSAGESAVLVGPSGCGKSTLLRVAAGLERPDAGRRTVTAERPAFVFQEGGLLRNVTVLENLRLPLYYSKRGIGSAEAGEAAVAALEEFGIAHVADARPSELLNETRVLAQFARAAALDADLLFLDDPLPNIAQTAEAVVGRWLARRLEERRLAVMMTGVDSQSVPPIPTIRVVEIGAAAAPAPGVSS